MPPNARNSAVRAVVAVGFAFAGHASAILSKDAGWRRANNAGGERLHGRRPCDVASIPISIAGYPDQNVCDLPFAYDRCETWSAPLEPGMERWNSWMHRSSTLPR